MQEQIYILDTNKGVKEMSEAEIRGYGFHVLWAKRKKSWILVWGLFIIWTVMLALMLKPSTVLYVGIFAPLAVLLWAFITTARKFGGRLWDFVYAESKKNKTNRVKVNL